MYTETISQKMCIQGLLGPAAAVPGIYNGPSVNLGQVKRALWLLDVGAVGAGGSLQATIQVSPDNVTWTNLSACTPSGYGSYQTPSVTTSGQVQCLEIREDQLANISSPSAKMQYARVQVVVAGNTITFGCMGIGMDADQSPASQSDSTIVTKTVVTLGGS